MDSSHRLTFTRSGSGLWRSICGRYAIIRSTLPEDQPPRTEIYTRVAGRWVRRG